MIAGQRTEKDHGSSHGLVADDRPLFDPHAFACCGGETLYALSQEGPADCAGLVIAAVAT